jgi:hypothetical protein
MLTFVLTVLSGEYCATLFTLPVPLAPVFSAPPVPPDASSVLAGWLAPLSLASTPLRSAAVMIPDEVPFEVSSGVGVPD